MGSKLSKAVRRHPSRLDALASTPGTIPNHKDRETGPCQALSLPEIKPLTPLVVDLQTTNAATASASNDNNSSLQAAVTNSHITDPQPDTLTSILEPPTSADAMDSLTQLLATDAQRLLDNIPAPPAPAPAPVPVTPVAPPPFVAPLPPPPEITCIICCEPGKFPKGKEHLAIKACKPCGSTYCAPCLKDMFVTASKEISRMPPRCCIQIPLYHAVPYLTKAEAAEFKSKYEEWSTPNPLYCPVPTCSTFIPNRLLPQAAKSGKQRIDSVIGTPTSPEIPCPKCSTDICTKCRQLAHSNQMCENLAFGVDEETAKLLKSWGYKRCPKCSNGVKRMFGCNHMECLCGAHWCWVCQKPNDECEGGCYEEDDDEYSDGEDEEVNEVAETVVVTLPENAEAPTTTGEPTIESTEVLVMTETVPQPTPRARNLDARSRGYWEDSGLDFGDEPTDNYADRAWNCDHRFETTKVSFADSLRSRPSTTSIECTKCWNPVHPEIEMPKPVNNGGARVVAGTARGYTGRGRAPRGRGRGRGRGATFMAELVRGDATIGTETGEQSSGETVIDTYGRTVTTTEFNMEPTRRASLHNITELNSRPSSLTSDAWVKYSHSQHSGFEGTVDDMRTHSHSPFSFAYECYHCGIVVCNTCKSDALADQEERNKREDARRAILEAEREARQAEADRLYELERPEREAREAAERREIEEQQMQQQVRERIEDERAEEESYENAWIVEVELPGILARREAERLRNVEMLARPENQAAFLGWLNQFDL